jgi:hypothetical protein
VPPPHNHPERAMVLGVNGAAIDENLVARAEAMNR